MEAHDFALEDQGVAVAFVWEVQVVGSAFVEEVVDDPSMGASVAEVDHRAMALEDRVVDLAFVAELDHVIASVEEAFGSASAEAFVDLEVEVQEPFRELFQLLEAYPAASRQS